LFLCGPDVRIISGHYAKAADEAAAEATEAEAAAEAEAANTEVRNAAEVLCVRSFRADVAATRAAAAEKEARFKATVAADHIDASDPP